MSPARHPASSPRAKMLARQGGVAPLDGNNILSTQTNSNPEAWIIPPKLIIEEHFGIGVYRTIKKLSPHIP